MLIKVMLFISLMVPVLAKAAPKPSPNSKIDLPGPEYYRGLTLKIRPSGQFKVPLPDGSSKPIKYKLEFGTPAYQAPIIGDYPWDIDNPKLIWRSFWDRVFLKDGSSIEVGGELIPLTCVFVAGQDNRASGNKNPLIPKIIMKVFLIAKDYSCQGPIRPGWPSSGGRKENWDTYLHFEVRDPTIMLPQDAMVRYLWNEFPAVLIDSGSEQ